MSAAVENGVDASKPRGVFSRAFAKRAQPFEEGEFCGENKLAQGLHYIRGAHGAFLVIGRCYLIKHDKLGSGRSGETARSCSNKWLF